LLANSTLYKNYRSSQYDEPEILAPKEKQMTKEGGREVPVVTSLTKWKHSLIQEGRNIEIKYGKNKRDKIRHSIKG
jgi:hypothetical protein